MARPDLVVGTARSDAGLYIILNLGNRSFGPPAVYLTGVSSGGTYALTIADMNQDGIPDIAVGIQSGIIPLWGTGGGNCLPTG